MFIRPQPYRPVWELNVTMSSLECADQFSCGKPSEPLRGSKREAHSVDSNSRDKSNKTLPLSWESFQRKHPKHVPVGVPRHSSGGAARFVLPSSFACNVERKCRRLGSMPAILSESLLPQQALSEDTEQAALWPAPGTEAAAGMDSEARTFIPSRVASAPPKHRRESSNSSTDSDTRDFEEVTARHSPSGHTGSCRRMSSPAACSAARSASNSSNSSSEKFDSAHVVAPAMAFEARAPAIVSEGRAPAMASGLLPLALTRAPPKLERLSSNFSTWSSILPYRYRETDEPSSKSDLADQVVHEDLVQSAEQREDALHRALAKNDKTDKGYDLTISASSMLGGFSIRDVLAPPT